MQFLGKKIGILGGGGMVGSDLVKYLGEKNKVEPITRKNYQEKRGTSYDILINANGNSKRYWANEHPPEDFIASTLSVYQSIFDFLFNSYIYISSPDVYDDHGNPSHTKENYPIDSRKLSPYGLNKYLSELIVKKYCKRFLILRCSMILGSKLNKGPFFDIHKGLPLFINKESKLQLITTKALTEALNLLRTSFDSSETYNMGGIGAFSFTNAQKYFKQKVTFSANAEKQIYNMNIGKLRKVYRDLKSSEEYLKDFLDSK